MGRSGASLWAWSQRWSLASSAIGNALALTPRKRGAFTGVAPPLSTAPASSLCVKGGMGATEIARAVGCKLGNVYKTLKAAGLNLAGRSSYLKVAWVISPPGAETQPRKV